MRRLATLRILLALVGLSFGVSAVRAQTVRAPDWRHIGNALVDLNLAGLASGPVERVWYVENGSRLRVLTSMQRVFETTDFETWEPVSGASGAPAVVSGFAQTLPEPNAHARNPVTPSPRVYAYGESVYR